MRTHGVPSTGDVTTPGADLSPRAARPSANEFVGYLPGLVFWGMLAVVFGNDLIRFWRVGDPPLENPADFFPLGAAGTTTIGVLGAVGIAAALAIRRATRLHLLLLVGLSVLIGSVVVAASRSVPDELPPAYQPFDSWRSFALMIGLVGVAAATAQWPGRYLRGQLFAVTVALVWLSFALTAVKWAREDPLSLVANLDTPETPSIFPILGLMWNANILALVLIASLVIQVSFLRSEGVSPWFRAPTAGDDVHIGAVEGAAGMTKHRRWWLWWVGPAAAFALLVASFSRAGIIVGLVVLALMLGPWLRGVPPASTGDVVRRGLSPMIQMALLGVGLVMVAVIPPLLAAAGGPGINGRDGIWERTWQAIQMRPLWGWGADAGGHQHAHNQVLESWQSGGVMALVGLGLVAVVAVIAAVRFISVDDRLALGLSLAVALESGVEVFTPWRKFPSLPLALILVVLGLVASISLGRDRQRVGESVSAESSGFAPDAA